MAVHPAFARAFEFLTMVDLKNLPAGRHDIDGNKIFVLVSSAEGRGKANAPLEAHRKYIDIQIPVDNADLMGYMPMNQCGQISQAYDDSNDVALFADTPKTWLDVAAGLFVIFFPADAHAPLAGEGKVKKAVIKVAV